MERGKGETRGVPASPECTQTKHKVHNGVRRKGPVVVLVKKKENRLTTTVYRKKTHTDRYIHFTSNHHPSTKLGVINCLKTRAERICDKQHIRKEIQHIKEVFMKNGYPRSLSLLSQCYVDSIEKEAHDR